MKKFFVMAAAAMSAAGAATAETVDTLRTYHLQSVQVTATRADAKTPVAFHDLSKRQIRAINYGKDLPALLNFTPSVTFSSDAGTGIGYTGIRVRGTDPTRINVTANGIPLNDSESSALFWVNMADFASSLESVQIQRGVGTSTNGAGAFGATVSMQTEHIGPAYGSIDLSAGSYGTHKETLRFSTGLLGGHWGVQGRLSNIGSDGYIDRASARLNSYFVQGGYFSDNTVLKLITFNGTEKTYHAWNYASKDDMNKYGRRYNPCGKYEQTVNGKPQTVYYDNQTDNYHQQHYQLLLNQYINRNWNFNAALHYTHGSGYYEQYKEGRKLYKYLLSSETGKKSDLVQRKLMDNDFYGTVVSANYNSFGKLRATVGGGWNRYQGNHYGRVMWLRSFSNAANPLDPAHRYYDNTARKIDGNLYGKVSYEFVYGLSAYTDLQYRYVNYKSWGTSQEFDQHKTQMPLAFDRTYRFFNPKLGLIYTRQHHTLYASYAIAHKEPVRNDFENMLAEKDQVDPQAERLNDLEIGYKFSRRLFDIGLNLYYMAYDNQFVLTGAKDTNGEAIARNIKDTYRMGVELQAALHPFRGFDWNIDATCSRNRAKKMELNVIDPATWASERVDAGETHLAFSPDLILNNVLRYEYKNLTASIRNKYVSRQYMTNSNAEWFIDEDQGNKRQSAMIDAYFTTDIDLSYTFKLRSLKRLTIGATVYNLFSEVYESNGSCALNFKKADDGSIVAFNNHAKGFDSWSVYSAQAPVHFMARVSVDF